MAECIDHRGILSDAFLKHPSNLHLPPSPPITNIITDYIFEDEVDNIDYHFESARLESYKRWKWPVEFMKPERLAKAGFYYTGDADKVKCFECRVEISQWLPDDDPMVDHQRWSGRCRFIRDIPCGNVPIGVDPSTIPPPVPKGRDVCGPFDLDCCSHFGADTDLLNNIRDTVKSSLESRATPKHPELADYQARLSTFETWPISLTQTKEQLANAGFFYTGNGDQTLCYHCGGGLKDWEPEDDPWEQHAKWFSKCYYLLTLKGQDYVNSVTGRSYNKQETSEQSAIGSCGYLDEKSSQISVGSQDSGYESIEPCAGSSEPMVIDDQVSAVKLHHSKSNDDARMCKICYNRELRKVFVPCGHLIACTECAKNMKTCAVCRKPVIDTVQAIIS